MKKKKGHKYFIYVIKNNVVSPKKYKIFIFGKIALNI